MSQSESSEDNFVPEQLAVVAMDWPNVWHQLGYLRRSLDFVALLAGLKRDAAHTLKVNRDDLELRATAFAQKLPPNDLRRGRHNAEVAATAMREAGWQVRTKIRYPDPEGDQILLTRLNELMEVPEQRLRRALKRLHRPAEWQEFYEIAQEILLTYNAFLTAGQRRTLRKRSRLLSTGSDHNWDILLRTCLEVCDQLLVKRRTSQIEQFSTLITEMKTSKLLRRTIEVDDLASIEAGELPETLSRLASRVYITLRKDHHRKDIDLQLTKWVHRQFQGRDWWQGNAVAYLVGDDYKNHLPAAERLRRRGVLPVFVVTRSTYNQADPRTRAALTKDPHRIIWLDRFFVRTDGRRLVS